MKLQFKAQGGVVEKYSGYTTVLKLEFTGGVGGYVAILKFEFQGGVVEIYSDYSTVLKLEFLGGVSGM